MPESDPLLVERGSTHGDFRENARIAQQLKDVIRTGKNWSHLTHYQAEALDMIMHKVGRILAGNMNFQDHWDDIDGYATLVKERNKQDNA